MKLLLTISLVLLVIGCSASNSQFAKQQIIKPVTIGDSYKIYSEAGRDGTVFITEFTPVNQPNVICIYVDSGYNQGAGLTCVDK